jgi:hypothetical protein
MKWRKTLLEGESPFSCVKWIETLKESATMWQWRIITSHNNSALPCKNLMYKSRGKYRIRVVYDDKHIGQATGKNQTECVRQYFNMIQNHEILKQAELVNKIFGRN